MPLETMPIVRPGPGNGDGTCGVGVDQPRPYLDGTLSSGSCEPECCERPQPAPEVRAPGGIQDPCHDQGQTNGDPEVVCVTLPTTPAHSSGPSPLSLGYYVDLSALPENAIIKSARATYQITQNSPPVEPPYSISDDGGATATTATATLEWSPAGVGELNAAMRSPTFFVRAGGTFSGGGIATFSMSPFRVCYTPPSTA